MIDTDNIIAALAKLSISDWVDVVGRAADARWRQMRQSNSNASTFYEIGRACSRLNKILKRATIG